MSVGVKQRPHALRELGLCLFDLLPRRHTPMIAPMTEGGIRRQGSDLGAPSVGFQNLCHGP